MDRKTSSTEWEDVAGQTHRVKKKVNAKEPIGSRCPTGTHLHFVCECVETESLRVMYVCILVSGVFNPALTSYVVKKRELPETPRARGVFTPMRLLTPQVIQNTTSDSYF